MAEKVKVTIRPMGGSPKTIRVSPNTRIVDVLDKAGVGVASDSTIVASGETVKAHESLGSRRELMVVPTVKGGKKI